MSLIVEAVVSAAINTLFDKLASTDLLQFARQQHVHDDLNKWKTILVKIQAVLDDAEEKQMTNRLVEIWLVELKNLAYDVEDILDEFATEALQTKILDESQASTSKVRKLIPTCLTGLNPRSLKLNSAMATQIKEITTRFQEIVEQTNNLDLKANSGANSNRARYQRPPATSLNEPHIYGRKNDEEAILELLLKNDGGNGKFSVISIEGMGGIGKTTLAQLVYNDARVKHHFDITTWIYVSDDFNVTQVTKSILQSIVVETGHVNDLNILQVMLKKKLSKKKFFIVLDDVWTENYEEWTILCRPFEASSFGSKIVVTTRNHGVSSMVGALPAYRLEKLSDNHCLSVFTYHSIGEMDFNEHQDLMEIGEMIVKRCQGLPLAAKTLGGLLRGKPDSKEWKDVLQSIDSNMWNLPKEKSGIIPALGVSYYYLPSHLKRCFAYCSIFPKGRFFDKKELILLWMAEGFLETKSSEKQTEDLGEEYFDDLHSRSFFQQPRDYPSCFVMHDLISDLAQWATKDFCFRIENLQEGEKQWKIPENLRHLYYLNHGSNNDNIKNPEVLHKMKSVRTILSTSPNSHPFDTSYDFLYMVLQLRRVRVLSLNKYPIFELPNAIGELKLLHHLDLSHTAIEFLPDSINTLYNLKALVLNHCYILKRLCSDMGNVIKLRHLYVKDSKHLEGMPLRIGKLTSLRTLELFVVGKDIGSGLSELKDLKHLQQSLHISRLENVKDSGDAGKADLNGKRGLKDLRMEWTGNNDASNKIYRWNEIADQVLERLQPCKQLESLQIQGYSGTRIPQWLGDASFSTLMSLSFQDCKNCAYFPSIGQLPSLKKLRIHNVDGIESLGPEFYGHGYSTAPFQSLEEFDIVSMQEWRDWFPCGSDRNVEAFPCLRQLSIRECPKLVGKLPKHLPSLENLNINYCKQLTVTVPIVPKHCTISICQCKEVVLTIIKDGNFMSSMDLFLPGISSGMYLAEGFSKGLSKVEKLRMVEYDDPTPYFIIENNLEALKYCNFDSFMIKDEEEELQQQDLHCRVQYLILKNCEFPVKLEEALQSLCFLRGLSITGSHKIISFPEASLPSQLRFIVIRNCDALQSLPTSWMHRSNTSLKNLSIGYCHSLKYIARVQLPPNLKRLEIKHCSNLLTVLDEEEVSGSCKITSCLEHLKIRSCPSLTSLWSKSNKLPDTLRKIKLSRCSNLTTLASRGNLPKALRYLSITECSKLESIAKAGDNTRLEKLYIWDCEKLETLPSGINNLISLKKVGISNCPAMVSIPEGGFPTSLTVFAIRNTKICKSLFEWGLHRLMSLELLGIEGCQDVLSFPQEETGMILPSSLTKLVIVDFPNLERLSSIVQSLTCLEKLGLSDCPNLKYFPDDGLPQSLKELEIEDCPLLEERCKEGEGRYWPIISHLSDKLSAYSSSEEEEEEEEVSHLSDKLSAYSSEEEEEEEEEEMMACLSRLKN